MPRFIAPRRTGAIGSTPRRPRICLSCSRLALRITLSAQLRLPRTVRLRVLRAVLCSCIEAGASIARRSLLVLIFLLLRFDLQQARATLRRLRLLRHEASATVGATTKAENPR